MRCTGAQETRAISRGLGRKRFLTESPLAGDTYSDGFGDASRPVEECSLRVGIAANALDCDDTNGKVNPSRLEICNGLDDDCDGVSDQACLTRALGELAGLGPSCDTAYECTVPGLREATMMYQAFAPCDVSGSTLEDDDRLGIRWLYGHGFSAACIPDPNDPMAAVCSVGTPEGGQARWDFGDGVTGEGQIMAHKYDTAGPYVVTACADVDGCDTPSCERFVVWAVTPGTVSVTDVEETDTRGCDSTSSSSSRALLAPVLMMLLIRSRRRPSTC